MGAYLLKSSIALLVFLSYYWFTLRNDTTFHTNRFYLLSTLIISTLLPLFEINWNVGNQTVQAVNNIIAPIHIETGASISSYEKTTWWTLQNILTVIYLMGASGILIKYFRKIIPWIRLVPMGDSRKNPIQIVKTNKAIPPFSFIRTIFLGNQEFSDSELNKIISHEKQHIIQYHWVDLIIVDILSIVFWFNPLIWIYDLLVKQNHEYLADNGVIAQGYNKSSYQALLLQQVVGTRIPGLASSFTQSLIKNRFIMMTKTNSRKITRIKALFALPLLLFLTLLFTGNTNNTFNSDVVAEVQKGKITGNVYDISTGKPLAGASIMLKEDGSYGTVSDINGFFDIEIPFDKAQLVVSYVGYETQKVEVNNRKVKILMQRATYTVSLRGSNVEGDVMYDIPPAPPPPPPKKDGKGEQEVQSQPSNKEGEVVAPPPPPKGKEDGMLVITQNDGEKPEYFYVVEDMPMPKGGIDELSKYLSTEIKKYRNDKNKESKAKVFFVVDKDGNIENVKIAESSGISEADKAAVLIVEKMPKWSPGFQRGKNVPVDYTIDIQF